MVKNFNHAKSLSEMKSMQLWAASIGFQTQAVKERRKKLVVRQKRRQESEVIINQFTHDRQADFLKMFYPVKTLTGG